MITQQTLRSILPGKIAKTVMLIAERTHRDPLATLKSFYASPTYAQLEREESKYWWLSPEQLATSNSLSIPHDVDKEVFPGNFPEATRKTIRF